MSADNGIYIASFPNGTYRVIEAGAIENCEDSPEFPKEMTDWNRLAYFGKSEIFTNKESAYQKANKLYQEILNDDFPVLEYGICEINFDRDLLNISVEEAKKNLEYYWKINGQWI